MQWIIHQNLNIVNTLCINIQPLCILYTYTPISTHKLDKMYRFRKSETNPCVFSGVWYNATEGVKPLVNKGNFVDFEIRTFKYFDSDKLEKGRTFTGEGTAKVYEFEFYPEDCAGGHYVDDVYYPAKKDTCIFVKPGQQLRTVFPYKCVILDIATDDPRLKEMLDGLPAYFPFLDVDEVVNLSHKTMAFNWREAKVDEDLTTRLNRQGYVNRILALVSRYYHSGLFRQSLAMGRQKMLLMLENHIKSHLGEDLSLKALAKICNLDPTYLHKLYTKTFGVTPANRVLMHRINAAKRQLLASEISMETVAGRCGFSSQAYFCYCFKKATGITPSQYRKDQLGDSGQYHFAENEENL